MPSSKAYEPSPKIHDFTSAGTVARAGSIAQPMESFVVAMTTAQRAYFDVMSQCAMAWLSTSMFPVVAGTASSEQAEGQNKSEAQALRSKQADLLKASDWLSMPVITGIEETFNDQLVKPRSLTAQEPDILTLWKRRNEFEAAAYTTVAGEHRDVA